METKRSLRKRLANSDVMLDSTRAQRDTYQTNLIKEQKDRADELDLIIDALGIRDAYPDIETPREVTVPTYSGSYGYSSRYYGYGYTYHKETVIDIDYGRDRFIADVKASSKAKKGKAALARLNAALKSAK